MRQTRGMTLLEIMAAVAVIGVMVTLAAVGIQKPIERQREREATRELWSAALRARQKAVATSQPVRLVVEAGVELPDGQTRTVARWERLQCGNNWDNNSCPRAECVNTTCRTSPDCCDEVGEDIIIPATMNATAVHGLCYLPGSGRAVRPGNLGCLQGNVYNSVSIANAAPGNLRLEFTSGRARSLLMVEPLTGLVDVLDCDSKSAELRPVAACTAQ